jgi:hypothetical protein
MVQIKSLFWVFVVALLVLVACGQQEAAPAEEVVVEEPAPAGAGGLDPVTQLALGTFKLEGTGNAVSAEQAATLLPLWTVIESGALQGNAESNAVVGQIRGAMTEAQLGAIDGMGLTVEDTRAWMEEQGIEMSMPAGGGQGVPAGGQAPGALGDLSEDERAAMRSEMQNLTAEERATRMAEMGVERPEGQAGGGTGARPGGAGKQANMLVGPLVELLTERSAG